MKLLLVLLFLPILGFPQESSLPKKGDSVELVDDFVPYSHKLQKEHFAKALDYEALDSFENAIRFHIYVAQFDALTQEGHFSKTKLDSIYKSTKKEILNRFKGEWNWIWSGSNYSHGWGDFPSTCHCEKKMIVNDTSIIIFENGKEIQRFSYKVVDSYYSIIFKTLIIKEPESDSIYWRIRLFTKDDAPFDYPLFSMKESSKESKQFLEVNYTPHYVCGILYGKYEKR